MKNFPRTDFLKAGAAAALMALLAGCARNGADAIGSPESAKLPRGPLGTAIPGAEEYRRGNPALFDTLFSQTTRRNYDVAESYTPGTIVIDKSAFRLYYISGKGKAIGYSVGLGKIATATPAQDFIIDSRPVFWETYYGADGTTIEPGLQNPLGVLCIYLSPRSPRGSFCIHGTNQPWKIGGAVSNGCIRMHNRDVLDLYRYVRPGMKVQVVNSLVKSAPALKIN